MRKLSLLLVLATVAAPAMAQDRGHGGRQHGNESSERSEARSQRASENRASEARSSQRVERSGGDRAAAIAQMREARQQRVEAATQVQPVAETSLRARRSDGDNVRVRRGGDGASTAGQPATNWRERERSVRTIPDTSPVARRSTTIARDGVQTRDRRDYRNGDYTRWSHNWRNDRRYDWNRYRNQHRSIFRIGLYSDPFGYNYRNWSVGSFLNAGYYGSNYWLNDPYQYRLPPAYGPYRWVRYWNDALLVNLYTGEVVDVMHSFFW